MNNNDRPLKVLQFGSGNFLRGFADCIIDVMNERVSFNASVQIIQSVSSGKENLLNKQNGRYHVLARGLDNNKTKEEVRLIRCVQGSVNANEEPQLFFRYAATESLRFIVSNTTESGIVFKEEPFDKNLIPQTFPGKLTAVLYKRFLLKLSPLIMLPCELIPDNGDALRTSVIRYAEQWKLGEAFTTWIAGKNIFCNTLVDRIVPGSSESVTLQVQQMTGAIDPIAVMVEPFHFWAIDAPPEVREQFPADKCGLNVLFTDQLDYYRERKLKILNGAHTAMMAAGYLKGFRTVKACLQDEQFKRFLTDIIFEEIIPTIDGDENDLRAYAMQTIQRFSNPFIDHQLLSIALNSIAKFRVRILPTILKFHTLRESIPGGLAKSFAALLLFYRGEWKGERIALKDDAAVIDAMKMAWSDPEASSVVTMILGNTQLWSADLNQIPGLNEAVTAHLQMLMTEE